MEKQKETFEEHIKHCGCCDSQETKSCPKPIGSKPSFGISTNDSSPGTFINKYLKFKARCIDIDIFNESEIIKLFEVWLHL
ncbi:MAG: hypothetical protein WC933_03845 [Candidatus Paceibacterota bacterium]|jgi:hypothetical protein